MKILIDERLDFEPTHAVMIKSDSGQFYYIDLCRGLDQVKDHLLRLKFSYGLSAVTKAMLVAVALTHTEGKSYDCREIETEKIPDVQELLRVPEV